MTPTTASSTTSYEEKLAALEQEIARLQAKLRHDDNLQARALLAVATRKKGWYQARLTAALRKTA